MTEPSEPKLEMGTLANGWEDMQKMLTVAIELTPQMRTLLKLSFYGGATALSCLFGEAIRKGQIKPTDGQRAFNAIQEELEAFRDELKSDA